MSSVKQRVFVSYSHSPREESEFARQLARRLRDVGFDPWLDEEQILGGDDFEAVIRKTIASVSRAVFLVTNRWLQRPYTRLELNLFSNHPDRNCRQVAVKREEMGDLDLAPQLQRLNVIPWLPNDPEPDACFWLVYCGLTGKPQGPRDQWDEEGRKLSRRPTAERSAPAKELNEAAEEPWLPCQEKPVLLAPSPHGTLLASDSGECFLIGPSGLTASEPLRDLQGCAAVAVAPDGTLVAGRYTPMVACLSSAGWEFHTLTRAPVLALAATPHGVAVGDAAGDVVLFRAGREATAVSLGEPVLDLQPCAEGLAALGAGGALGYLVGVEEWDEGFQPVSLPLEFARPTGLFEVGKHARVGCLDGERLALVDLGSGKVIVGNRVFPAGIRQVVALKRRQACYGVLTDGGDLWLLEADLSSAQAVAFPGASQKVAGICRQPSGGVLAWTVEGSLFAINRENAVRKLAADNVVLAHAEEDHPGRIHVVRWLPNLGAQVRLLRSDNGR